MSYEIISKKQNLEGDPQSHHGKKGSIIKPHNNESFKGFKVHEDIVQVESSS